ncbi:MAG TPA: DUF4446 domain-containing protein [Firmicutes bacterium]|jgi:hypothetical protein|nr:DUF4446 domain-containing protein [Bacillota bacterium]
MEEISLFFKWAEQNVVGLLFCSIALNMIVLLLLLTATTSMNKYRNLLQGADGKDLETLLLNLVNKANHTFDKQSKIEEQLNNIQVIGEKHLQNWSLIRFQAFQNTGGDQSFAFAMLDAMGDGIVMSSIFGREEARVYCKPVNHGSSTYPLSQEEKEAIQKALGGVAK